jgi:molybdate transport system substrate-binding protein
MPAAGRMAAAAPRVAAPSAAIAASVALLVSACGGGEESGPRLVVSAASSLTEALTACSRDFPDADVRLQFAGSDELAAQIRRGVKPDVFAAANTRLPDDLRAGGLLGEPVVFATNRLVMAIPTGSKRIQVIDQIDDPGAKLAIGSESVPVGSLTRKVLRRFSTRDAILANVRSEEPDVKGVVGKLMQKAVDAGFIYYTDVVASKGKLHAFYLPDPLRPTIEYGAGVVTGSTQHAAARKYVNDLVSGRCADALERAGFGPAP